MEVEADHKNNAHRKHIYAASMTLSGITLPKGRRLQLTNGVVAANPLAASWESGEGHPANVVPSDQKSVPLKKIARWLLAFQFEAEEPVDLKRVHEYAEKITLPLRLGTPGTVLLDSLKLIRGTLENAIAAGSGQAALEPHGLNLYADLSEKDCVFLERCLPQLTYNPQYDLPLVHYATAYYQPSSSEVGLKYLLALETLFDPNGQERDRASRVSKRASTFAATSVDQKREMRKDLEEAYKHRGALRHGETDMNKLKAAQEWFDKYMFKLRMIAAWAIQRVLRLSLESGDFDLLAYVASIGGGNKAALNNVMNMPLFWASAGRTIVQLDLKQSQVSGLGSVEFIRTSIEGSE